MSSGVMELSKICPRFVQTNPVNESALEDGKMELLGVSNSLIWKSDSDCQN